MAAKLFCTHAQTAAHVSEKDLRSSAHYYGTQNISTAKHQSHSVPNASRHKVARQCSITCGPHTLPINKAIMW